MVDVVDLTQASKLPFIPPCMQGPRQGSNKLAARPGLHSSGSACNKVVPESQSHALLHPPLLAMSVIAALPRASGQAHTCKGPEKCWWLRGLQQLSSLLCAHDQQDNESGRGSHGAETQAEDDAHELVPLGHFRTEVCTLPCVPLLCLPSDQPAPKLQRCYAARPALESYLRNATASHWHLSMHEAPCFVQLARTPHSPDLRPPRQWRCTSGRLNAGGGPRHG